jgi:glycosyltransferase involved in cell wall biosynthesis
MGRRHHLEQTLAVNLALCQAHLDDFEVVLVDYNSPDGLSAWVHETFPDALAAGTLKLVSNPGPRHFHVAHAKNIAHKHATKDIVVNLDADNFLSRFYLAAVQLLKPNEFLLVPSNQAYRFVPGTGGRIALYRLQFMRLGGYDERLNWGWGFEDVDLYHRAQAMGLHGRPTPSPIVGSVLPQTDEERTRLRLKKSKSHMDSMEQSRRNIEAGNLIANKGRRWGELGEVQLLEYPSALPRPIEQIEYELDLQGFVILPGILPPWVVEALNLLIDEQQGDTAPHKFSVLETDPVFMDLIENPLILPLLRRWLGEWFRLDHVYGLQDIPRAEPPAPARPLLHAGPYQNQGAFQYHWHNGAAKSGLLVFSYVLTDIHPGDGGLNVIPGSHKQNLPADAGSITRYMDGTCHDPLFQQPAMKAGDVFLFTEALVHGTAPWMPTDRRRRMLYYKYTPGYMCWRKYEEIAKYLPLARTDLQRALLRPPYVAGYDESNGVMGQNNWRPRTLPNA